MPLESCMLVLDNSEYMRNGDYLPTRFEAQAQAVSTVFSAKTDSNPESAVGLMTMAGKSPSLLVTPTNDIGKLLSAAGKAMIGGMSDLQTAIQIAQLALKHRENKNQRQRIVVFVGSPIEDDQENLVKLGKKLRKNNVLIDIVTFGEEGMSNDEKLNALVEAAGGGESHLVSIPPAPSLLADMIASSPILFDPEMRAGPSGDGGEGDDGMAGEVDPNMDPELAMAIRMSLAEAAAREGQSTSQAAESSTASAPAAAAAQPEPSAPTSSSVNFPETMTAPLSNANESDKAIPAVSGDEGAAPPTGTAEDDNEGDDEEDEEEMMRRAMALSRGDNPDDDVIMGDEGEGDEDDEEDEDAAIARAIQMSLEEGKDQKDGK